MQQNLPAAQQSSSQEHRASARHTICSKSDQSRSAATNSGEDEFPYEVRAATDCVPGEQIFSNSSDPEKASPAAASFITKTPLQANEAARLQTVERICQGRKQNEYLDAITRLVSARARSCAAIHAKG